MDRDDLMLRLGSIESDTKTILKNQEKQDTAIDVLVDRISSLERSKAKALGWAAAISTFIGAGFAWLTGGK